MEIIWMSNIRISNPIVSIPQEHLPLIKLYLSHSNFIFIYLVSHLPLLKFIIFNQELNSPSSPIVRQSLELSLSKKPPSNTMMREKN